MNKLIKNLLMIPKICLLTLLLTTGKANASDNLEVSTNVFDCLCAAALSQAYQGFENYITTSNLEPLYKNLRTTKEAVEKNTQKEEDIKQNIENSNEIYKAKILEAKEFLFELKKYKKQI